MNVCATHAFHCLLCAASRGQLASHLTFTRSPGVFLLLFAGRFNSGLTSVASSPSFDVTHGFDRGDDCAPAGSRHPPLPRETKVKLMCCSARRDRVSH